MKKKGGYDHKLFLGNKCELVPHINAYLQAGADLFLVRKQRTPLFEAPLAFSGNKPIDGGHLLFTADQKAEFLAHEPQAAPYFRPWYGSDELISGQPRYFLWLGDCSSDELKSLPLCCERRERVRQYRLSSTNLQTQAMAATPTKFHVTCLPQTYALIIPQTSTGKRDYLPIAFIDPTCLASNLVVIVPGATCYHFSILGSHLSMLWTKAVGNTLGAGCRYTIDPVYLNFPWPEHPEPDLVAALTQAGQDILAVRAQHGTNLETLYNPKTMPQDLKAAHERCERLVHQAYGLPPESNEQEVLARLYELHRAKVLSQQN